MFLFYLPCLLRSLLACFLVVFLSLFFPSFLPHFLLSFLLSFPPSYFTKHELTIGMEFGSVRKPLTLLGEAGEDSDADAKIQVVAAWCAKCSCANPSVVYPSVANPSVL
jgi:hypothetical protein